MSSEKMQLAQLAHSTLYKPPAGRQDSPERFDDARDAAREPGIGVKRVLENFVTHLFVTAGEKGDLDWRNPEVAAQAAARQIISENKASFARQAFQFATAGQIRQALAEAIGEKSIWTTRFQREDLADVIYAACVGALGERDAAEGSRDLDKGWDDGLKRLPEAMNSGERVRGLRKLLRELDGTTLGLLVDGGTRIALVSEYRAQIYGELKTSSADWLNQLKEGLTLDTTVNELQTLIAELDRLEARLPQQAKTWELADGCAELRSKLTLLSRRQADQEALKTVCPKLATVLTFEDEHPSHQVKDKAESYFRARRSLDVIFADAAPLHDDLARIVLNERVMDPRMLGTLSDIANGDSTAIDTMFRDTSQIELAQMLKLAGSMRTFDAEAARLAAKSADPSQDRAALRKEFEDLDAKRSRRIQDIEVERAFRTVSALLTDAQLAIASQRKGILQRLRSWMFDDGASQERPAPSVSVLKGSLLADARTIRLLGVAASDLKIKADFLIADFIRLSHAYAGTLGQLGAEDLEKPISDALDKLTADGSLQHAGVDRDDIQRLVAQGFRSSEDVAACSARIAGFITQLKQAPDLKATEEELFVHVKAKRVLQSTVQKWGAAAGAGRPSAEPDVADAVASERLKERLQAAHPWLRPDYMNDQRELTRLKTVLEEPNLRDDFNSFAGTNPGRPWVDSPEEMRQVRNWLEPAYKAFSLHDQFERCKNQPRTPDSLAQIKEISTRRIEELSKLAGLNLLTLTKNPNKSTQPAMSDLERIASCLADLDKAVTLQSRLLASTVKFDVKEAVRMAVLQEAAASPHADWPEGLMPAVLERLANLGLSENADRDQAKADWQRASAKLDQYAKKSLSDLVTAWDPRSKKDLAEAATRALAEKVAAVATGQAETLLQKSLQRNAGVIESRVHELRPGEAVDLKFGRYGQVSVGVPLPVPLISVSTKERLESSHLIRVSCDAEGTYSVRLAKGHALAASVTVGMIGDLIALTGGGTKSSEDGFRFTTRQKDDCLGFVKALASGDASQPHHWRGLQAEKVNASSSSVSGSASAELGVAVGGGSAGVEVVKGKSVETRESLGNKVEVRERSTRVSASAGIGTLAEVLSAGTTRGWDVRVAVSDVRGLGGLVSEHTRVRVSSTLLNDDRNGPLSAVLPPTKNADLKALAEKMDGLEAGGEVFVTYRLTEEARNAANLALVAAQQAKAEAGFLPQSERSDARNRAKAADRRAAEILSRSSSYRAEGLGWTRKTQSQSAEGDGLSNFANGTAERTEVLRFEGEHRMALALQIP